MLFSFKTKQKTRSFIILVSYVMRRLIYRENCWQFPEKNRLNIKEKKKFSIELMVLCAAFLQVFRP